MRLLVITRFLPLRDLHGGCTYLADCLEALQAMGWTIECAFLTERPGGASRIWTVPAPIERVAHLVCPGNLELGATRIAWRGLKHALLTWVKGKLPKRRTDGDSAHGGAPSEVKSPAATSDRAPAPFELAFAHERIVRFDPDVVMADFTFMAPVLPAKGGRPVCAILTHDVLHERVASFRSFGLNAAWSAWSAEEEAALLRRAEVLVAISEPEAETFRRICPEVPVVVAPMSAAEGTLPKAGPALPKVRGRCLFVGGTDAHNVHGLRWFLAEVWPLLRQHSPEAALQVCGTVCGEIVEPPAGVELSGRVPDLAAAYAAAEVCIVPILAGSGIKIKLVEALTHGCACVTTTAGLRGLEMLREGVALGDSPGEFALALAGLLANDAERSALARKGKELVAGRLSPSACYGPFASLVRSLLTERQNATASPGTPPHSTQHTPTTTVQS